MIVEGGERCGDCVLSESFLHTAAKTHLKSLGSRAAVSRGMHPKTAALQARTQKFAADVIKLCDTLAKDAGTQRLVSQLVDSSGSTDSN